MEKYRNVKEKCSSELQLKKVPGPLLDPFLIHFSFFFKTIKEIISFRWPLIGRPYSDILMFDHNSSLLSEVLAWSWSRTLNVLVWSPSSCSRLLIVLDSVVAVFITAQPQPQNESCVLQQCHYRIHIPFWSSGCHTLSGNSSR